MKCRVQIQVKHLRPASVIGIGDRCPAGEGADQVDENIDPTELLRH